MGNSEQSLDCLQVVGVPTYLFNLLLLGVLQYKQARLKTFVRKPSSGCQVKSGLFLPSLGGHTGLICTTWIRREIKKGSFLKEMGYRFQNFLSHICEKALKKFLFKPALRTENHLL